LRVDLCRPKRNAPQHTHHEQGNTNEQPRQQQGTAAEDAGRVFRDRLCLCRHASSTCTVHITCTESLCANRSRCPPTTSFTRSNDSASSASTRINIDSCLACISQRPNGNCTVPCVSVYSAGALILKCPHSHFRHFEAFVVSITASAITVNSYPTIAASTSSSTLSAASGPPMLVHSEPSIKVRCSFCTAFNCWNSGVSTASAIMSAASPCSASVPIKIQSASICPRSSRLNGGV